MQTDRLTDRQRQADKQEGKQANRRTERKEEKNVGNQTQKQAGRQIGTQADSQTTCRQTGKQADRQASRQTGIYLRQAHSSLCTCGSQQARCQPHRPSESGESSARHNCIVTHNLYHFAIRIRRVVCKAWLHSYTQLASLCHQNQESRLQGIIAQLHTTCITLPSESGRSSARHDYIVTHNLYHFAIRISRVVCKA